MKTLNAVICCVFFLLTASCASEKKIAAPTIGKLEISLAGIASDSRFLKTAEDRFQTSLGPESEIKIFRFAFENQKQLNSYLENRRKLLKPDFEDHFAPYTGLMAANQNCKSAANVKAELQKSPDNSEHFFMDFPVTSSKVISDCLKNDVWGIIRYTFYNCKKRNELFEVRHTRSLQAAKTDLQIACGY